MKVSFRDTLLLALLFLIGSTVLGVAAISYHHARDTLDDLVPQILEQTSARTQFEIDRLLRQAVNLSAAAAKQIETGKVGLDNFRGLVAYLQGAMELNDGLTSFFVGVEQTGN